MPSTSQNPYSIYDKNLPFCLPCLNDLTKNLITLVSCDHCDSNSCSKQNFWRAFVYGLIDYHEKVASSRKHAYAIQDLSIQEVNNTEETV